MLDRSGWVDANVGSMRNLLAPLTERVGERIARSPLAPIGRTVTATELGVLLGWAVTHSLDRYGVEFALPVGSLVAFTVVAVAAGILAAVLPARRAAKLDVLSALQYE